MKVPHEHNDTNLILTTTTTTTTALDDVVDHEEVVVLKKNQDPRVEDDSSRPSLDSSCTDIDASSLDDSSSILYESDASLCGGGSSTTGGARGGGPKRRVSFSKIEVREYSLTVGDHPLCQDGLPLSLDWDYNAEGTTEINMSCSRERLEKYQMPPRLSYEEKRGRLIATTDYSDERTRNKELGQVIQRMQSWWQQHPVLPMPNLFDIVEEKRSSSHSSSSDDDDEEEEKVFEIEPPKLEDYYVVEWRRNVPRRRRR